MPVRQVLAAAWRFKAAGKLRSCQETAVDSCAVFHRQNSSHLLSRLLTYHRRHQQSVSRQQNNRPRRSATSVKEQRCRPRRYAGFLIAKPGPSKAICNNQNTILVVPQSRSLPDTVPSVWARLHKPAQERTSGRQLSLFTDTHLQESRRTTFVAWHHDRCALVSSSPPAVVRHYGHRS